VTKDLSLHDDLYQEALIHLWLTESRRPNQTESWYLQSCKFHMQHYLASGRSVDSRKRRVGQWYSEARIEKADELPEQVDSTNPVFALVSTRDLISLLSRQLLPREKAVLDGLVNGLGMREIGRRLNISHTMALRHRAKIARLLLRLERPPFLPAQSWQVNGFKVATQDKGTNRFNGTNHAKRPSRGIDFLSMRPKRGTRFEQTKHARSSAFSFEAGSK